MPLSSSGEGKARIPEGVGSISRMGTCVGARPGMDPVPDGGLVASPGGVIVRGGCVTGGPGMPGAGAGGAPGVVGAGAGGVWPGSVWMAPGGVWVAPGGS